MNAAQKLFNNQRNAIFPICTQLTISHGICRSKCRSCPVGQTNYGDATDTVKAEFTAKHNKFMSEEVVTRVIDEVAQYKHAWIRFHARGEPLLHPRFISFVEYATHKGVRLTQTFTDAIALDEDKSIQLLNAGLGVLECSVHGHTQTYEQLMRNGKFETVKTNIIRFRVLRDKLKAKTKLVVSAVDQPLFQVEKAEHNKFWNQYADEVIYRPYHSWGNRIDVDYSAAPASRQPCSQLWNRCTIGPTGNILACFNSWSETEEEVLGNVMNSQNEIATVWQSKRFSDIRKDHFNGNYTLSCCKNCNDWSGSAWGNNSYDALLNNKLMV